MKGKGIWKNTQIQRGPAHQPHKRNRQQAKEALNTPSARNNIKNKGRFSLAGLKRETMSHAFSYPALPDIFRRAGPYKAEKTSPFSSKHSINK